MSERREPGHLVCPGRRATPLQQNLGMQRGPSLLSGRLEREFQDVDVIWQTEMQARIGPCLARAGATPSADQSGWQLQLQQHHLTPESCGLW